MRALVWFRSDLRIEDNPALHAACEAAPRGVIGVFMICPAQWREHDWGDAKVDFLLRNLRDLSVRLQKLRIPLLLREAATFNDVPSVLLDWATRLECTTLFHNEEYEVNERRRDAAVRARFEQADLEVRTFRDQLLVDPATIRTKTGGFYTVFTPFKRAWLRQLADAQPQTLSSPRRQPALVCPPDDLPEAVRGFGNGVAGQLWPAGEVEARARLRMFIEKPLAHYHRNRDRPDRDGTSRLSPYLALGVLSPRCCLQAALEANHGRAEGGRAGAEAWINELIWREFYRYGLIAFPRLSMGRAFKETTDGLPWRHDEDAFARWCAGRTGVPLVDAGMRQLLQTGWMHNRLRMITAMYLTKNLLIDWRWGERHFMRHLIDGDLANNNGGWQWCASTGTDAVPYFRIFNPYTQAKKLDPEGTYIRAYVPELKDVEARCLHTENGLPPADRRRCAYPPPHDRHDVARRRALAWFKRS
jgi:deoxyribodipyrimidine photo-lyase